MLYRFVEMLFRMSERRNGIENTSKSRGRRASQTALTIVTGAPVSAKVDGGPGIRIMPPLPFIASTIEHRK